MGRLILRRLAWMVPTVWVVSILIYVLAEVLPGDPGRTILGRFATVQQVAALDRQLGVDRPLVVRYGAWLEGFVTGHWGSSVILRTPILPLVTGRLWNSVQLALVALVITVPLSLGLGVIAGLRRDSALDRVISVSGLSLLGIPEFVSGVVLLVVFAVSLRVFPATAQFPPGTSFVGRLHYLILPAIPLMFALFGYVARMARAGTIDALESSYVRTAVLKGLPWRHVVVHHVLRNSVLPSITVIGFQIGWLVGGLVVIETLFNYPGIGSLMLQSALDHDLPVLEATVVVVACIYVASNLAADVLLAVLNPRIRRASDV